AAITTGPMVLPPALVPPVATTGPAAAGAAAAAVTAAAATAVLHRQGSGNLYLSGSTELGAGDVGGGRRVSLGGGIVRTASGRLAQAAAAAEAAPVAMGPLPAPAVLLAELLGAGTGGGAVAAAAAAPAAGAGGDGGGEGGGEGLGGEGGSGGQATLALPHVLQSLSSLSRSNYSLQNGWLDEQLTAERHPPDGELLHVAWSDAGSVASMQLGSDHQDDEDALPDSVSRVPSRAQLLLLDPAQLDLPAGAAAAAEAAQEEVTALEASAAAGAPLPLGEAAAAPGSQAGCSTNWGDDPLSSLDWSHAAHSQTRGPVAQLPAATHAGGLTATAAEGAAAAAAAAAAATDPGCYYLARPVMDPLLLPAAAGASAATAGAAAVESRHLRPRTASVGLPATAAAAAATAVHYGRDGDLPASPAHGVGGGVGSGVGSGHTLASAATGSEVREAPHELLLQQQELLQLHGQHSHGQQQEQLVLLPMQLVATDADSEAAVSLVSGPSAAGASMVHHPDYGSDYGSEAAGGAGGVVMAHAGGGGPTDISVG
ncbi:hypothetical protein Agub_g10314, partial [Astrephomene gubernaculifera]